jgi:uncharacterized phage protein (TIGR02218 family)
MSRTASAELLLLINNSSTFIMADLYTFTLSGAAGVLRYSGAATPVIVAGVPFPTGPRIDRSSISLQVGTTVDELRLSVYPEEDDLIGTLTWPEAGWRGLFDSAIVKLERAFMPSYGHTSPGTVVLFTGRVGDINVSSTVIEMAVRSQLEILASIQMPRRLWQSPCTHLFGGEMCSFDRTSLQVTVAALTGSTAGLINVSLTPSPINLFDQGTATGTLGANDGESRTITSLSAGVMTVKPIFPSVPMAGDTFNLLPGCNRSFSTCQNTFNNVDHFGGFPYIPAPETAI